MLKMLNELNAKELNDQTLEDVSGGKQMTQAGCRGDVWYGQWDLARRNSYTIYRVASGDTVSQIAAAFHTSVGALQRANARIIDDLNTTTLVNPNLIRVGDRIIIP